MQTRILIEMRCTYHGAIIVPCPFVERARDHFLIAFSASHHGLPMSTDIGDELHSFWSSHEHTGIMFLFECFIISDISNGSCMSNIPWSVSEKLRKLFVIDASFEIFFRTEKGCKGKAHRAKNIARLYPL